MVEFSPTFVFLAILLSVPLQFYLSPRSSSDVRFYYYKFLDDIHHFCSRFIPAWGDRVADDNYGTEGEDIHEDEEIITDLIGDREQPKDKGRLDELKEGRELFGGSDEPRDPRPPHVLYRVGQVVRHKVHNYRGVIIAWDEKAKAPKWWLEKVHKGHKEWADEPNYTIIIDTRDRLIPQIGYVVQENVVLEQGAVIHPLIKHYFESFDGTCYKSRPWHNSIYPND